jgi:hypothetical protein
MSGGDEDTVKIGLAKLQLRPGDLLCVSVPDSWTGADVVAFQTGCGVSSPSSSAALSS